MTATPGEARDSDGRSPAGQRLQTADAATGQPARGGGDTRDDGQRLQTAGAATNQRLQAADSTTGQRPRTVDAATGQRPPAANAATGRLQPAADAATGQRPQTADAGTGQRPPAADASTAATAPAPPTRSQRRRAIGLTLLVLAVAAVHGCVGHGIAARMADLSADAAMPARIEVAYVRELAAAAPAAPPPRVAAGPAAAAAPRRQRPRSPREAAAPVVEALAASAPDVAASSAAAPDSAASEPAVAEQALADAAAASSPSEGGPLPAPAASAPASLSASSAAAITAASVVAQSATASAPASFDWPSSTRLRYVLTGNYRGRIDGSAEVEWVRRGDRYQTHVDVTVGLAFAPLLLRRTSSEGRLGADGLVPERYDEDSKAAFRDRRRATVRFEPDAVVLANGERRERPAGVQDSASQFVQLTWLFTTQPERLVPGNVVELPLALPRKVDRWVYEVAAAETLATTFGPLDTFHLRPRRKPEPGSTLTAEMWLAPSLRYMPVRIRIRQDDDTFIDLLIDRLPEVE